jgi:hypothetical protein
MTSPKPRLTVCGAQAYLPADVVPTVLAQEPTSGWADPSDVNRRLRCALEQHARGIPHHGIAMDLDGLAKSAVWGRWETGTWESPEVVVLADCPAADDDEPCTLFADHPGRHTYEVPDPLALLTPRRR